LEGGYCGLIQRFIPYYIGYHPKRFETKIIPVITMLIIYILQYINLSTACLGKTNVVPALN